LFALPTKAPLLVLQLSAMKITLALVFTAATTLTLPLAAQQNPTTMPKVATVDPRFQSYNIEMVEIIGGRFWKPYASKAAATPPPANPAIGIDPALFEQRTPIDLSNPRLRKLAAALGPAYIRVSGSWANTVFFQDSDAPAPTTPPKGFAGVLTRAQWKGVVKFADAVGGKLVTSFSTGMGTRDATNVWTPTEASKFVSYNNSIGGKIAAAEFMNEPTFPVASGVPAGYDGAAYGRDYAVFQPWFRKALPNTVLLGPGSVGEGIDLVPMKLLPSKEILAAVGPNPVDAFSYHFYGGVSERCSSGIAAKSGTTPDAALTEDWLTRTGTVEAFYANLRDTYAPGKSMWLTETGQTACGGDRWASTYLDSFRYLDQLGRLATLNVKVVLHNTLAASDYALIDEQTLTPRPNYWAALLWHNTVGTTVLDAGTAPSPTVHLYAQCMKNHPGGVTLLALNLNRTESASLTVPETSRRFTLTSTDLMSRTVQLNGKDLMLSPSGDVPVPTGLATPKGAVSLPAASITFFTIPEANNVSCK
jgi:heparanase 1